MMTRAAPAAAIAISTGLAAGQPRFIPLGFGDQSRPSSVAAAISGDGRSVTGTTSFPAPENSNGFLWNEIDGLRSIGRIQGLPAEFLRPRAISFDGSVIAGGGAQEVPFRWSATGGPTELAALTGVTGGYFVDAVSGDGTIIGGSFESRDLGVTLPLIWTQAGATVETLPDLPGGDADAGIFSIDKTGAVISGYASDIAGPRAAVWFDRTGPAVLAGTPILVGSIVVRHVTLDGSSFAGDVWPDLDFPLSRYAFVWTSVGGFVPIRDGSGFPVQAETAGISDGANFVAGNGRFSADGDFEGWLWDLWRGARPIRQVLAVENDLDITGWTDLRLVGISHDGSRIAGNGRDPAGRARAFVAEINAFGCNAADTAAPLGVLSSADVDVFRDRFFAGDPRVAALAEPLDVVSQSDIESFVALFFQGCFSPE